MTQIAKCTALICGAWQRWRLGRSLPLQWDGVGWC